MSQRVKGPDCLTVHKCSFIAETFQIQRHIADVVEETSRLASHL